MAKVNYKLYDFGGGVFLALVPSRFDLAMLFMRPQEFYESDNKKFRGKRFDPIEYMQWYAHNHDEKFSYPQDWVGFNLPSEILEKCMLSFGMSATMYDKAMLDIIIKIRKTHKGKFCLIGTQDIGELRAAASGRKSLRGTVLGHEVAHAVFYLDDDYRKKVLKIVRSIPAAKREMAYKYLRDLGYSKKVFNDEIQAYMVSQMGSPEHIPIHWSSGARISRSAFEQVVSLFDTYNPVHKNKTRTVR